MLGFVYLLSSFIFGFCLVSNFLKSITGLAKLAASFLVGIFIFSWLTFIFSLVFSFSNEPLKLGILGTFGVFSLILLIFKKKLWRGDLKLKISLIDLAFLFFCLIFSFWIMGKSFGYDKAGYFKVASNIFDDFNVHLSLMRSFSWGKNFPSQLPFFAGEPIKYHFLTDFTFAIFEYLGWNPGWAINIPSALAFASVLVLIYSVSQKLFGQNFLIGFISVILFLFNSSLTWFKLKTLTQIWWQGKYLSAGPFDGGIISIFWNLNTYVNQRHLVVALGLFLIVVYILLSSWREKKISTSALIFAGVLIGLLPFWHGLVFLATVIACLVFWVLTKFRKSYLWLLLIAFVFSLPQIIFLSNGRGNLPLFKPGFLIVENLTLENFVRYWVFNLGFSWLTIPAGFLLANREQKNFYLPIFSLFIVGNLFQFSRNMFHNHSLFNLWIVISNFYSAYFLVYLFQKRWIAKLAAIILLVLLTFSGVIDLMVIKNDFIHRITDAPQNKLISWIKQETSPSAVFLSGEKLYNPVNLAGRKVFLGASHFVWGYGYDIDERKILTSKIEKEDNTEEAVGLLKKAKVDYWLTTPPVKFDLPRVYEDESWVVYQILKD